MSAYLLVSLPSQILNNAQAKGMNEPTAPGVDKVREHDWRDFGQGYIKIGQALANPEGKGKSKLAAVLAAFFAKLRQQKR